MDKLNGFNNGRDTLDGFEGKESWLEWQMVKDFINKGFYNIIPADKSHYEPDIPSILQVDKSNILKKI